MLAAVVPHLVSAAVFTLVLGLVVHVFYTRAERGSPREWLALLGLVGLAALLRGWGLGDSSLEHLEASYLFEGIKPETLWGVLTSRQAAEQMHQPLFPLLIRGWAQISTAESWLRLPSLLWSVLCVPLMWTLVRDTVSKPAAVLVAALTAAAPLLVWYGRDASPYALLAVLSLAALASGAQQLARPDNRRVAIRTGVLLASAFYSHFHGGWVAVSLGAWLLWTRGWRFKSLWITTGTTAALCLPWLPALIYKLTTSVEGLERDQALMRYSHDLGEAIPEALRLLLGGQSGTWALGLAAVAAGTVLLRNNRALFRLLLAALVVGLVAELHILWQLQVSKGIVYVDVRHYLYLGPVLLIAVAALPGVGGRVVAVVVIGLQLWTSVALVTLDKPDVRTAMAYVRQHATGPAHGVGYLPAPWYEPMVEWYLTGPCERLVHAHSREGWWRLNNCFYSEFPVENAVYGYPPSAERFRWAADRTELDFLWMVDIQDHRFGLRTPPTTLQEQWHCYDAVQQALIRRKTFGDWVTVSVYDAARLRTLEPPAPWPQQDAMTVTSQQSWELSCRKSGTDRIQ